MSRAAVRIGGSLDLDTVLDEVVDGARILTGARFGLTTTIDEAGRPGRSGRNAVRRSNQR